MRLTFAFMLGLQILTGCSGPRAVTGLGTTTSGYANSTEIVPLLIATARSRSDDTAIIYSRSRSEDVNFSTIDVAIPQKHRKGNVETSSSSPDPRRHFSAVNYSKLADGQAMIGKINDRLSLRPSSQRELFIFVHGYNNNFAEGIFRNAQIVHDYDIGSLPLHFSWASAGNFKRYLFDRDSAFIARNALAETLELASQTKASGIIIVGHSMGAIVVMEALRTLSIGKRTDVQKRIRGVLLAAPDLDPDLFRSQLSDIRKLPQPFTIIVSRRDRALDISRRLSGGDARIGSGVDIALLQNKNIQVLDTSQVDGGGHAIFASSSTLIKLLGSGHLLHRLITDEYAGLDDTFVTAGQSTFEQASLALHLPARIIDRMSAR
ncbi:alpha/beta fold hydrolase [Brucella sp. HL-2]|nr:alpha/beta fold hydrolase [Brucella sp. HL-2]MCV9909725.1 alpha/beta fold hydrolase [Brucella sp. HL-2]